MEQPGEIQAQGGLLGPHLQMEAKGPQDLFLTTPPEVSALKYPGWKRHGCFGIDRREHPFNTRVYFGKSNEVTLDQCGDVIGALHLHVVLPALVSAADPRAASYEWVPRVGRALLYRTKLILGESIVQDHERLFLDAWDKCRVPLTKRAALDGLLGGTSGLRIDREQEVIIPLRFFCCSEDSRLFFPVVRATQSRMAVYVELEELWKLLRVREGQSAPDPRDTFGSGTTLTVDAVLWADHYLLTQQERVVLAGSADPDIADMLIEGIYDIDATDTSLETGKQRVQSSLMGAELPGALVCLLMVVYRTRDQQEGKLFEYVQEPFKSLTIYHDNSPARTLPPLKFMAQTRLEYGLTSDLDGVSLLTYALRPFESSQPSGMQRIDRLNNYRIQVDWADALVQSQDMYTVKAFATVWHRLKFGNDTVTLTT